jgi:pyruvate formate lyase activating enzyme
MSNLAQTLDQLTVEGELYESLANDAVRCYACGHRCLIREGRRGICQVRFNQKGKLQVPWGYVAARFSLRILPKLDFLAGYARLRIRDLS